MFNIIIYRYFVVLIVTSSLLLTSCQKYLDVNVDPNNPTEVSPSLVLPVAQKYTANIMDATDGGGRRINTLGNMMMYNWSQTDGYNWYPDEFKYNVTSSFYQGIFRDSYSSALKQYNILTHLGDRYEYYKAIGMIMEAYHFQLLVDLYGDVPYSEALLRKDNATPVYDNAKTIYHDLVIRLSKAITLIDSANINGGQTAPTTDDIMFGGNMTKWIQFANTIKMRILVREAGATGVDAATVKAEIDSTINEPHGFITKDVLVNPGYMVDENRQNPFWNLYGADFTGTTTMTHKATCATDYVIGYLKATHDPRMDSIYTANKDGKYVGVPQGLLDYSQFNYAPDQVSLIGKGLLKGPTAGACIFTLAESYFNRAEAAQLGLSAENAQSMYEEGITASFAYLGVSGASSYYSQAIRNVSWSASPDKMEAIITQKWIAVNGITAEQSWFDYSKYGYPTGLPISLLARTQDRPVRLDYIASEYSSNGANVPKQPNAFTDKIFWGK